MIVILTTEHLLFRTFTMDDASLLYQLNSDPDVIRYTYDPIRDIDEAKTVIDQLILPQYNLYNHGRWAVHVKDTMEFIGWCGLKYTPERNETDLGYRFMKLFWGKGFATEAAQACIQYGFEKLGIQTIIAKAVPENKASLRVLEKCGMSYNGTHDVGGYPMKVYMIHRPPVPR